MDEKKNSFLKTNCFALTVGGIFGVYLLLPVIISLFTSISSTSYAAKHQQFLQTTLWDINTLVPARTNFSAVILSGAYELYANGHAPSSGQFEIAMSGHDLYFKRRWEISRHYWYWNIEMAVTNFYGNYQIHPKASSPNGAGGGGVNYDGKQALLPGRRLWDEMSFIGASSNILEVTNTGEFSKESESFSELKQYGPYLIPQRIVLVDYENYRWTYHIKKVEFRTDPTADWFVEIRSNCFHFYSPQMEQELLSGQSGSPTNK